MAQWEQLGKRRNKEEERKNGKNERKDLTLTGLLMEGVRIAKEIRSKLTNMNGFLLTMRVLAAGIALEATLTNLWPKMAPAPSRQCGPD